MKALNSLVISGKEALPVIEGGKGISVSNGESSGAWAAAGGVGTFSGVNADSYDASGEPIPQIYKGKDRRARHNELIAYSIRGGITQAQKAHDLAKGGRIHMNILWEMAAAEQILEGVLEGAKGLIHGVTCGAGMPYKVAEIAAKHNIYYYPIVSSARAFRALWLRAYHKHREQLGGVVYEDPWLAGGHNGLSNSEDPKKPEDPYPRVVALRAMMRELGVAENVPVIMAGGVWWISEWEHWLDNPEIGPVAFQFGTRPLLTQESPISNAWKQRLLTLKKGDVYLNRFSPTGFYSSAVRNPFLQELHERSERQIAYSLEQVGEHTEAFQIGAVGKPVYLAPGDLQHAKDWIAKGFSKPIRTPDSTLVFETPELAQQILADQVACMGCLSACNFSNWSQNEAGTTGRKPDPRSFCIQKTLQNISHDRGVEDQLMFAGHNAYRFATDPWYANGFVPTVKQLVERIASGQ
ncbi:MAG TPA: nitronate monooxygenase [Alphaproteobacteria bacterium]|nr:nitronate monooxygenase [Alphaproteobacteria bacterium]